MEKVTQDTLDNFRFFTKYDIETFFNDFIDFLENNHISIISYYSGRVKTPDVISFKKLADLIKQYKEVIAVTRLNASSFTTYDYWILLEEIEEIGARLDTIDNYSVWLRSSITKGDFNPDVTVDYTVKQGQTIEQVEANELGSSDPNNTWVDTLLRNQVNEEDYTPDGGLLLKVSFSNGNSLFLNSVVDNIDSAEKTYGLDIDRKITIVDDDLKVLSYKETFLQSLNIYAGLKQGDNPDHPGDGIRQNLVVGNTYVSLSFPVIFRQMAETFSKNDSWKSFSVIDIDVDKDALKIFFQVESRVGEVSQDKVIFS